MTDLMLHRLETARHWNGMLCPETRDGIAKRMYETLTGKWFTMVICNSYRVDSELFLDPEVRPSQYLTSQMRLCEDRDDYTYIGWNTPKYAMSVHTSAKTYAEALSRTQPLDWVRFTFGPGDVEIEHYAPAGYFLRWIFAVETHDPEDETSMHEPMSAKRPRP